VLISQESWEASDPGDVVVMEMGPVELKGIAEPLRLHAARRRV
jgi:class 3 adenylate cyclase